MTFTMRAIVLSAAIIAVLLSAVSAQEDPYLSYLKAAPEFKAVKQDPRMMIGRWDTWIYMPWRYQWTIGEGDEGGRFCKENGFNGGFSDHGEGPLDWLEKWHLKFYNDHTAAKGFLHLRGAQEEKNFTKYFRDARAIRAGTDAPQPLDDALLGKLKDIVTQRVNKLKDSPMRVAYALDDEVSWGAFVLPIPWRVNADDAAYESWLKTCYGGKAPAPQYVTPDYCFTQYDLPVGKMDFSPLLDRLTYNDGVWANFIGALVEHANSVDPDTPCGFVGGQSPSIWGGYDYAKISRKIQFIEAYDLGSSQEIIRSFNPKNAMPVVTTHFHSDESGVAADKWQSWYFLAHGNRGIIGWVEGWFDGPKPRPWLAEYAPTLKEIGGVQGPKMVGARWIHDGVAIYYSHPSIQVSYCLDIECHGKTWVNRRADFKRGTSHTVRKAWENILSDAGIQYNFLPYNEVAANGVPAEYKVLILPACYALSDAEAAQITRFAQRGGTVIADFACGLFDQHGKGRTNGALDTLFGAKHTGGETRKDFFSGDLWVESDQDKAYDFKSYAELLDTVKCKMESGYAVAETRLPTHKVTQVGKGKAVYLNLSPLRYLQYREEGKADEAKREPFVRYLTAAGVTPWLNVSSGRIRPRNAEATYWAKDGRTLVFIVQNVPLGGADEGGGHAKGLVKDKMKLDVEFARPVKDVVDERTGNKLGDGATFTVDYDAVEAAFLSFEGPPPAR
jgi:hypothetical protein